MQNYEKNSLFLIFSLQFPAFLPSGVSLCMLVLVVFYSDFIGKLTVLLCVEHGDGVVCVH